MTHHDAILLALYRGPATPDTLLARLRAGGRSGKHGITRDVMTANLRAYRGIFVKEGDEWRLSAKARSEAAALVRSVVTLLGDATPGVLADRARDVEALSPDAPLIEGDRWVFRVVDTRFSRRRDRERRPTLRNRVDFGVLWPDGRIGRLHGCYADGAWSWKGWEHGVDGARTVEAKRLRDAACIMATWSAPLTARAHPATR